ncbi:MAG TPA: TIGR03435 family protein [Bryobacteraceae bacterium]|jgi:uncharacterized protein (TIGR03435 family)
MLAAVVGVANSQISPPSASPAFEVASVKPTDPAYTGRSVRIPPDDGMVTMRGWSLKNLLLFAWGTGIGLHPSLLSGGPSWIDHDRYDIVAKSGEQRIPSQDERKQMLRILLVERFQLKYHRESREIPVYALVVGKRRLKMEERRPDDGGAPFSLLMNGGFHLPARDVSMTQLADMLQSLISLTDPDRNDLPVVDRTGLTGKFDFDLTWAPDPALSEGRGAATKLTSGPDLFIAVEEQLGVKIETQKAPMNILVVDHAEKALEN